MTNEYSGRRTMYRQNDDNALEVPTLGEHTTVAFKDEDDQATVWNIYSKKGEHYDHNFVDDANKTADVILIFAGLFSAVVTTFIGQTYQLLQPGSSDVLASILQQLENPGSKPPISPPFEPPSWAIRVNCFLFASLFTSVIVAFLCMLVKQWASSYEKDMSGISSPHLRARIRHLRYMGAKKWRLAEMVGFLSVFMYLSMFIASIAIIDLLFSTVSHALIYFPVAVCCIGAVLLFSTTILPLTTCNTPFRSPVSDLLVGTINNARLILHKISGYLRFKKTSEEEPKLDNYVEQMANGDKRELNIAKSRLQLDLAILTHLLSEADQSTERGVLELCLEKLSTLSVLEKRDPEAILSQKVIYDVVSFLAEGCLITRANGRDDVLNRRMPRAKKICDFLTWFLSLPYPTTTRKPHRRVFKKKLYSLPDALARSASSDNKMAAYSARGRLDHFLSRQINEVECETCNSSRLALENALRDNSKSLEDKAGVALLALTRRTECLLIWEKRGERPVERCKEDMEKDMKVLAEAFNTCLDAKHFKKIWDRILEEKEPMATDELKRAWFQRLLNPTSDSKTVLITENLDDGNQKNSIPMVQVQSPDSEILPSPDNLRPRRMSSSSIGASSIASRDVEKAVS